MSDEAPAAEMTAADWVVVAALCKGFGNDPVGPVTWVCRYAWWAFYLGEDINVDAVLDKHVSYLSADDRQNLVGCIEFLRQIASKARRVWDLPDAPAFDISQWINVDHLMAEQEHARSEIDKCRREFLGEWTTAAPTPGGRASGSRTSQPRSTSAADPQAAHPGNAGTRHVARFPGRHPRTP